MSCGKVCGCCGCHGNPSEKSIVIYPIVGQKFQVKLRNDNSYRDDVFVCTAADDRTVVGSFLTRQDQNWYRGKSVVLQRDNVEEFFLNGRGVLNHLLCNC